MNKIIERNLTLEFDLDKLAKDFGYDLEVDEHDDVYHNGYSKKDMKSIGHLNLPEKYENIEKIFPEALAIALEDAERSAWASYIRKERINSLKECLERIDLSGGGAEYTSIEQVEVSTKAGITSVEIDEVNNKVVIEIYNPEHLINSIVNGVGYVYPDLPAQTESSNGEIKKRFHDLKDYFEVYGETKPSENIDNRYSPDIDEDYLKEELSFRLGELSLEDVVDSVKESIDNEMETDMIMDLATKFTGYTAKEIAKKLIDNVEASTTNLKNNFSGYLKSKEKDVYDVKIELNEYIEKMSEIKPKLDEICENINNKRVLIVNDGCDEYIVRKVVGYLENYGITVQFN